MIFPAFVWSFQAPLNYRLQRQFDQIDVGETAKSRRCETRLLSTASARLFGAATDEIIRRPEDWGHQPQFRLIYCRRLAMALVTQRYLGANWKIFNIKSPQLYLCPHNLGVLLYLGYSAVKNFDGWINLKWRRRISPLFRRVDEQYGVSATQQVPHSTH